MPIPFSGAAGRLSTVLMPGFEQAERGSHQAIDAEYAEDFLHYVVLSRPNYQAAPDPQVKPQAVRVTFFWEADAQRMGLTEERIQSRIPKITADRFLFRHRPKRLDRFYRLADATTWEVTKVEPDGLSGLVIHLVQFGVPS